MAVNQFRRYVWLLELVWRSGGIKFDDISYKWEKSPLNDRPGEPLPKKTFHNHIKAIEEMFGIHIINQRFGEYRYVVKSSDDGELSDVQEAMLQQLRLSNTLVANPQMSRRIILDKSIAYQHLNPLLSAMEESKRVKIYYWKIGTSRDCRSEFIFEPYFIKQFEKEWFVVGRVVEDNEVRILLFDHIRKIESLEEDAYCYLEGFDINQFVDSTLELIDSESGNIIKEKLSANDDRELFALLRFKDTIYKRSTYGSFIPDEVL